MNYKNTTLATLDYIAVIKYGMSEEKGFFGSTETVQELILKDYSEDKYAWRNEVLSRNS
tara:strand:- start:234 stop:410 length:177 start_codon:yes stop_codon:yes gene_type:complete